MKLAKKLSLLLAVTVLASCFTGLTVLGAAAPTNALLFSANFENDYALNGMVPETLSAYSMGTGTFGALSQASTAVVEETTGADSASYGTKYVTFGKTETTDLTEGASDLIGGSFTKPVSSGVVKIEFDAKIYKSSPGPNLNAIALTTTIPDVIVYPFVANNRIGYVANDLSTSQWYGATTAGTPLFTTSETAPAWNHYVVTADLTNNTSSVQVNGGATYTLNLNYSNMEFNGFAVFCNQNGNISIDNLVIVHNPVEPTVILNKNMEDSSGLAGALLAGLGVGSTSLTPAVVNVPAAPFGNAEIIDGSYDLGTKAYSVGYNNIYKLAINGSGYTNGTLKMEFDVLVGNGGFAIGLGSNASGGGLSGRVPFVMDRVYGGIGYQAGGGFTEWTGGTVNHYTIENSEHRLNFTKNKWSHVILEFEPALGNVTVTVDGVRSNTLQHNNYKNITSLCFMYGVKAESYSVSNDKTAYLDNVTITHIPDFDIKEVDTADGKVLLTMKKAMGELSTSDVTISDAVVTDVAVSGNKVLVSATGLADGCLYGVQLSDTALYADSTSAGGASFMFTHKANKLSVVPEIINIAKVSEKTVSAILRVSPELDDAVVDMYVAAYDAAGDLVAVIGGKIPVSKFRNEKTSYYLDLPIPEDYTGEIAKVKAFAWDANMIPYAEADEVVLN